MTAAQSSTHPAPSETSTGLGRGRRLLDPIDRSSEILFGLIMVLAITGSISVAEAGREDIRTMLIGALACNFAWGIVDAAMYLMAGLTEQVRGLRTLQAVRTSSVDAARMIAEALPPILTTVLGPAELETIRARLEAFPGPPTHARLRRDDWLGALAVFFWVFLSAFPVVVPFIFMDNALRALRVSNAIAMFMLAVTGHSLGRHTGGRPWLTAMSFVLLGVTLVAITIALGG